MFFATIVGVVHISERVKGDLEYPPEEVDLIVAFYTQGKTDSEIATTLTKLGFKGRTRNGVAKKILRMGIRRPANVSEYIRVRDFQPIPTTEKENVDNKRIANLIAKMIREHVSGK